MVRTCADAVMIRGVATAGQEKRDRHDHFDPDIDCDTDRR